MTDSDREARVIALLEHCVQTELEVVNGGLRLGLSSEVVESLMEGVTAGILYGFSVDWSPSWLRHGDVHAWEESGTWFARCGTCLQDSPASSSREAAANWALKHQDSH